MPVDSISTGMSPNSLDGLLIQQEPRDLVIFCSSLVKPRASFGTSMWYPSKASNFGAALDSQGNQVPSVKQYPVSTPWLLCFF